MKVHVARVLVLTALLLAPALVLAKGRTVRIEISGAPLSTPLAMTAPEIVREFSVWTGPGTWPQRPTPTDPILNGAFIDWRVGPIPKPPHALPTYKVSFYCQFPRTDAPEVAYVVFYQHDPSTQRGYIYLPGPAEEHYGRNVSSVIHDVEGNWFQATDSWQRLVSPLLVKATRQGP
jgi:hypothetical protein